MYCERTMYVENKIMTRGRSGPKAEYFFRVVAVTEKKVVFYHLLKTSLNLRNVNVIMGNWLES